jgi:hypothetical protein
MIRFTCRLAVALAALPSSVVFGFTTNALGSAGPIRTDTCLNVHQKMVGHFLVSAAIMSAIAVGGPALADEYGKETEAPTLFTGETVMVSWLLPWDTGDVFVHGIHHEQRSHP